MSVPFSNVKIRVPNGFQNLLEAYITEVLRQQPENLYEFGAVFFEEMIAERQRTGIEDVTKLGNRIQDRFYNMRFKRATDDNDQERADAALKIQTEYRRHEAAVTVDHMRHEEAGEVIQAALEGHADRAHHEHEQRHKIELPEEVRAAFGDDVDPEEMTKAALKIQAGFKGLKIRRQVRGQLAEKSPNEAQGAEVDEADAGESAQDDAADHGENQEQAAGESHDHLHTETGHDGLAPEQAPEEQGTARSLATVEATGDTYRQDEEETTAREEHEPAAQAHHPEASHHAGHDEPAEPADTADDHHGHVDGHDAHEAHGHEAHGHEAHGHEAHGHEAHGHEAHDADGHDADGHDADGHDADDHHAHGHDADGHDADDHHADDHHADDHHADDHHADGHDADGHNADDHHADGHDADGHNADDHHADGHNADDHHAHGLESQHAQVAETEQEAELEVTARSEAPAELPEAEADAVDGDGAEPAPEGELGDNEMMPASGRDEEPPVGDEQPAEDKPDEGNQPADEEEE